MKREAAAEDSGPGAMLHARNGRGHVKQDDASLHVTTIGTTKSRERTSAFGRRHMPKPESVGMAPCVSPRLSGTAPGNQTSLTIWS
jgi:hypothetical protein